MACEAITGSGCAGLVSPPTDECADSGGPGGVGAAEDTAELHGGGCGHAPEAEGCAAAVTPAWGAVFLAVLLWGRRAAVLGLLLFLGAPRAHADDVDAELFSPEDGGPALTVVEAELGPRWSAQGALSGSVALSPVVEHTRAGERDLLAGVATGTLGGSVRISDGPRLGAWVRTHQWLTPDGVGHGPGDSAIWISVPLVEAPDRGVFGAFTVDAVLPTGPEGVFLHDESGAVDGRLSGRWRVNAFAVDAELGAHLQRTQTIVDLTWAARYRWALALSARPWGLGLASAELFGSGPFEEESNVDALTPIETDASAGGCLRTGLCARVGGGGGLTYGVGAPSGRLFAVVDWRQPARSDRDGDGVLDLRDRCVDVPEDLDLIEDGDGCPEDDADGDRIPDVRDLCPTVPEVVNGFADEDGCPDVAAVVKLTVRGDASVPTESALVDGLSADPTTVFLGEEVRLRVPSGTHAFTVEAEGYVPWSGSVDAFSGDIPAVVDLVPVRYGAVHLTLVDAAGAPLAGYLRRTPATAAPEAVPAPGLDLRLTTGTADWTVYAPGFAARTVHFEVKADDRADVRVMLAPVDLAVDGDRITTQRVIRFDLDKADPRAESLPVVDDLASLLAARPDIVLLRIEGHADESGTSRHNLELSRARATAVRDALVARGVDPARLEALGSGEARRGADTRTVDFVVLVWADEAAPPPNPPGR